MEKLLCLMLMSACVGMHAGSGEDQERVTQAQKKGVAQAADVVILQDKFIPRDALPILAELRFSTRTFSTSPSVGSPAVDSPRSGTPESTGSG